MPPPIRPHQTPGKPSAPAFPVEPIELGFRAILAVLRTAPSLAGRAAVHSWDGDTSDRDAPGDDSGAWIRLTPSPGPSRIYCRTAGGIHHRTPLVVQVETSVPGSSVFASTALWGAILAALYPGPRLDARIRAAGFRRAEVLAPAWGGPVAAPAAGFGVRCEGSGRIEFLGQTRTPE